MYTQACFLRFDDGELRNGYISSNVDVDEGGTIDPKSPGLDHPIQWVHNGDKKGIVYDSVNNHIYRLNGSWDSTLSFIQSLFINP